MTYPGDDRYTKEIKDFYKDLIDKVTRDDWSKLDPNFKGIIESYLKNNKPERWYLTLFRRKSFRKL